LVRYATGSPPGSCCPSSHSQPTLCFHTNTVSPCPGSDQHCRLCPLEPRFLCAHPCVAHVGASVTPCRARVFPPRQAAQRTQALHAGPRSILERSLDILDCPKLSLFSPLLAAFPTDPIDVPCLACPLRKPVDPRFSTLHQQHHPPSPIITPTRACRRTTATTHHHG
jgi:hypothetical protein